MWLYYASVSAGKDLRVNQDTATTSTSTDSVDVVTIAQNTTINLGKISELVKRNEGFVMCKKENVCHHAIFLLRSCELWKEKANESCTHFSY